MAQPRAHVYLLRGLMNVFSLGMDTLAEKIQRHGIFATVHNHTEWETLADQAAAAYRAGKEGPIIIVGHSLGADAVMQMSAYLGRKGVPVALAVPFDARGSYATSSNVGRLLNLTHAGYGYMSRGAGFHGSLSNMDVSSDRNIDHLNIDKSARLHTQVLAAILEVVGNGGGNQRLAPAANDLDAQRSIATPEAGKNGAVKPADSESTDSISNSIDSELRH
jgi:thioesterase domain-containing protein